MELVEAPKLHLLGRLPRPQIGSETTTELTLEVPVVLSLARSVDGLLRDDERAGLGIELFIEHANALRPVGGGKDDVGNLVAGGHKVVHVDVELEDVAQQRTVNLLRILEATQGVVRNGNHHFGGPGLASEHRVPHVVRNVRVAVNLRVHRMLVVAEAQFRRNAVIRGDLRIEHELPEGVEVDAALVVDRRVQQQLENGNRATRLQGVRGHHAGAEIRGEQRGLSVSGVGDDVEHLKDFLYRSPRNGGNLLGGPHRNLVLVGLKAGLAFLLRAVLQGHFVNAHNVGVYVLAVKIFRLGTPDGDGVGVPVPDDVVLVGSAFDEISLAKHHTGVGVDQKAGIRPLREHRLCVHEFAALEHEVGEAHRQSAVGTGANRYPKVGLGSDVTEDRVDDHDVRTVALRVHDAKARILARANGVGAPHYDGASVAVVACLMGMEHTTPGHMRLSQIREQANMGRPNLAAAVPGVVQAIEEVVGATTRALGNDNRLRTVFVDNLAHLRLDEIDGLIPRDALPLVLAAIFRMGLVHRPRLALHGVLQAIGMGVDLLGRKRLHAKNAVVDRAILIALYANNLVVVIDSKDDATFGVAVEAYCAYLFFHVLPPSFLSSMSRLHRKRAQSTTVSRMRLKTVVAD